MTFARDGSSFSVDVSAGAQVDEPSTSPLLVSVHHVALHRVALGGLLAAYYWERVVSAPSSSARAVHLLYGCAALLSLCLATGVYYRAVSVALWVVATVVRGLAGPATTLDDWAVSATVFWLTLLPLQRAPARTGVREPAASDWAVVGAGLFFVFSVLFVAPPIAPLPAIARFGTFLGLAMLIAPFGAWRSLGVMPLALALWYWVRAPGTLTSCGLALVGLASLALAVARAGRTAFVPGRLGVRAAMASTVVAILVLHVAALPLGLDRAARSTARLLDMAGLLRALPRQISAARPPT